MPAIRCPKCASGKVRLAPCTTSLERLYGTLTIYSFRCQLCAARFRSFVGRRHRPSRRSFERISVAFPVWFKSHPGASCRLGTAGILDNLSLRGCHIRSPIPLARGTRLELEFQYVDSSFPITIDEAVVRTVTQDGIGLRFVQIQREDAIRLGRIMDVWLPDQSSLSV